MSRSRRVWWSTVAVLIACVGACKKPTPEEPPPTAPAEDIKALADGNNAFAVDLYKKLAENEQGKSIIYSPYSVRTALAMTYAGARGQTANEMRKALHFTLPDDRLHTAFGATSHQLKGGKHKQYELNVANSLWGQMGFPIRAEFLDLTKKNYAGGFRELDFGADPDAARGTINRWVEEETRDRIKELLQQGDVTRQTRLVLVNAIYFKGQWAKPFDPNRTKDDTFRVSPDHTVPVRMMSQYGEFSYGERDDAQLLGLGYRSGSESGLYMVIILPKAVDGLAQLEAKLSAEQFREWLGWMGSRDGSVELPRFDLKYSARLNPHLSALGMSKVFGSADFSGVTPEGGIFIDGVIHQAVIEVSEEGTIAAAATAVVGRQPGSAHVPQAPFKFRADHPFLYAIVARPSGNVLFLGRYTGTD